MVKQKMLNVVVRGKGDTIGKEVGIVPGTTVKDLKTAIKLTGNFKARIKRTGHFLKDDDDLYRVSKDNDVVIFAMPTKWGLMTTCF